MKIDRLIGIITMLLRYDKITAPELAEKFEVSRRTISRDIEAICNAGIPIVTTQGYGGGIYIANGYKIDKALLTKDELQAVFTGLKSIDSISKTSHSQKLIEKLSINSEETISAEDVIFIDLGSHYKGSIMEKIEIIKRAILKQNEISFQYYYGKGQAKRIVEPYLLLFKWSSWYLYAFCLDRKDYRLFKLNRLWQLEVTKTNFKLREVKHKELDLDNFFKENTTHLKAIFSSEVKYRLIEEYGIDCFYEGENGQLIFEWDFASYENMENWIMSFGSKVQVLIPKKLRQDICDYAEKILEIYKTT